MLYYILRSSDNVMVRHGSCGSDATLALQAQTGEYVTLNTTGFEPLVGQDYVYDPSTDTLTQVFNLAGAQGIAIGNMNQACQDAIIGGFTSDTFVTGRFYPSGLQDQTNMSQVVAGGGKLWNCDASHVWTFDTHTQPQAAIVMTDFVTMRNAAQANLVAKTAAINAAMTQADIDAITW